MQNLGQHYQHLCISVPDDAFIKILHDISIKQKTLLIFHSLTFVLHQYFQLFSNAIIPAADVHMERVITTGFGVSCLVPLLKGGQ